MGADKYSYELKRTLDSFGHYQKYPDRGWKKKGDPTSGLGNSDLEPGFPDGMFVGADGRGCFIEAKTGDRNFPFANWRPNQREWYEKYAKAKGMHYWLFLVMGEKITSILYPRSALLMTAENFLELEAAYSDRKSLPFDAIMDTAATWRLRWGGNGTWILPHTHPFRETYQLWEDGRVTDRAS